MLSVRPRPPFLAWPIQACDRAFGYVWFAQPAVIATQTTVEHGDIAWATYVHDRIDQAIALAAPEISASGGILFIHDFRSLRSYDKEARLEYLRRMRQRKPGYSRGTIVAIRNDQPLLRMGIQAANLLLAVAVKAPLSVVDDPRDAIQASVQSPPASGTPFPGCARM